MLKKWFLGTDIQDAQNQIPQSFIATTSSSQNPLNAVNVVTANNQHLWNITTNMNGEEERYQEFKKFYDRYIQEKFKAKLEDKLNADES